MARLIEVLVILQVTLSYSVTTPPPVPCTAPNIPDSTYLPNQASFNSDEIVSFECNIGYELTSGSLNLTCDSNGTWIETLPTCTVITCASPDVTFGTKSPATSSVNFNITVTYACDTGYEVTSGDTVRVCDTSSDLSGTLPVCSIKTCPSSDVPFATESPASAFVNYNTAVTYTCDTGYEVTSGDTVRTCEASSVLSGTLPVCSIVNCSNIEVVTLGTKSPTSATVTYGTSVTYTCDFGYEISSGDASRTCQASGSLSGTLPVCILITCASPDVTFGTKSPATSPVNFNITVTYACDTGYEVTSGDTVRVCDTSSDLSGTLPVCSIKTCVAPAIAFANKSPNTATINYNTDLTYACITGYNHTNGDLTRTCQHNSTLSGDAPTCTIVTCAEPANITFATKSPVQPSYDYNTPVVYTCDMGYKLDTGDLTRTCTADGTWSGTQPACTIVTCAAPPTVSHSSLTPIADPYTYNTTLDYTCDIGYEQTSGTLQRTCQATGFLSGSAPVCTIKTCAKEVVANGAAVPDTPTYDFNTSVIYSCNLSFNQTDGDLVRTCNASAMWTGTLPVCTVAACIPENTSFGSYNPPDVITQFGDTITYICDIGYYISAGDATRTCQTDGSWTNTLPICSLVRCDLPATVMFSTYSQSPAVKFDYNTDITYSCNLSYNHTAGNLTRTCKEDFNWTGDAPTCTIAACIQDDSTYMATTPNKILHEFGDIVVYDCILGYNYSSGDTNRTCINNGSWTGEKPECVIITCDPPAPIAHTSYVPNGLIEHDWNTSIDYSCDADYHYVSGGNITTCNESGSFPPSDVDCSVKHFITVSPSEPALTWFNTTVNETTTVFDFDGMCVVTITCDPNLLDVSHVVSGTEITMTLKQTGSTQLDDYICTMSSFHGERTYPDVNRTVFFGDEIVGFQAWLDHTDVYLEVGKAYHFEANATSGSVMSMLWALEDNITKPYAYNEDFSYMDFMHTFNSPWTNVTVSVSNAVSSEYVTIPLKVIYALNNIDFNVNNVRRTTTQIARFDLSFNSEVALGPMGPINITITLLDGNAPVNFITDTQEILPSTPLFQKDLTYDTQGNYKVTVEMVNPISSMTLHHNMMIWDKLNNIELECVLACPIAVTHTESSLEFTGVPRSGFEYSIDMNDAGGTTFQSINSSILYELYSLSYFNHTYTTPGNYNVAWSVSNGGYSKTGNRWIVVENEITNFQAFLDHTMIYLAVWDTYNFYANATLGTSVSIDWKMEDNITVTQSYPGEFSTGNFGYAFTKPKTNIKVTARNLVSSQTVDVIVEVFYKINNFTFTVASTLGNTTHEIDFDLHLLSTALLPMKDVNISIDFKHGSSKSDNIFIDQNYGLDQSHMYAHLFDMQGNFLVEATLNSILGSTVYNITMRIWDSLLDLDLEFINGFGKYIITNTTARFNFTNVPNYGFEYTIDYGDGTTGVSSTDDSLLYAPYNLPVFTHVFTSPGVYKVSWTAKNGAFEYDRADHLFVYVQNKVPNTGFTLEPISKKYPWSVLQNMSISLNITLDVGIPVPTNATCLYEPDDGSGTEADLTFDSSFFNHLHTYANEGFYNSTFNCSNDVSSYTYIFDIEVRKFLASDLSLVFHDNVPLNHSDSVVVYFHIDNGGFEILPYYVTLDWDFGDGHTSRRRRSPLLRQGNLFSRVF
ncbi:uncharacterized protein LOC132715776 [Ruditapes philippinarum]|uniref:uncharacterized protein LOC132715776 n=1 Tax=Ruditapes philippinarum TaxID=129788 RepID=UPI00295B85FF|nr:uncharacterized protein LOC132715776 [Ruditapes philippinarum]